MSLRSAARLGRPAITRALPRAPVVARRAASSSATSSNLPWALGSAAFFGSLGSYIMFSGPGDHAAHAVHEQIAKKAAGDMAPLGASEEVPGARSNIEDEDKDSMAIPGKGDQSGSADEGESEGSEKESIERGLKTDASPVAAAEGDHVDTEPKASKGKSGGEEEDGEYKPSEEEIKKSINRAEKSAVAPVAMDEEAKGRNP